jgi:opacity protein-like surface antigen
MATLKTLRLVGALSAAVASPALAADMLFPPTLLEAGRPGIVELGTGWYLRGDAAYVDYITPKDRGAAIDRTFANVKLDQTWSAGGGFGYKFTNLFRADVTADYHGESTFAGTSSLAGIETRRDWGKFDSTTALVNGYIDLGDWGGITPYVGAGAGAAVSRLYEYQSELTCLTRACGVLGKHAAVPVRGRTSYDFAWALMAGVAVDVGGGFKVDVGYRYLNLGEAQMRYPGADAATRTKDLDAHEIRIGLRYMIDN